MDKSSNSPLNYRQIAGPAREIISYIDKRRKGQIESLKTRWRKFNDLCMGGIEPNSIYTIAGISGSGNIAVFMGNHKDNYRAKTVEAEMLIPW